MSSPHTPPGTGDAPASTALWRHAQAALPWVSCVVAGAAFLALLDVSTVNLTGWSRTADFLTTTHEFGNLPINFKFLSADSVREAATSLNGLVAGSLLLPKFFVQALLAVNVLLVAFAVAQGAARRSQRQESSPERVTPPAFSPEIDLEYAAAMANLNLATTNLSHLLSQEVSSSDQPLAGVALTDLLEATASGQALLSEINTIESTLKEGARNGASAQLMKLAIQRLTKDDMVAIAAYVSGLVPPQVAPTN